MKSLKYILLAFLAISLFTQVHGQDDDFRSSAPEAGPARKIEIGEYDAVNLKNGMRLIVVENHKRPVISYQLFLDRDPLVEGDRAGMTSMVGDLLSRGTTSRTKAEIDEAVDFIGASLNTNSQGGFASSLTKHTDEILEIFADVIQNPSFPEEEFDKIKTQFISGLQTQKDDPNAISGNVTSALIYGLDHPYGEIVTETTVENVSIDDVKEYYNQYFKPNIAYMVVVGDITTKEARQKIDKYFGAWEQGDVPQMEYEMPELPDARRVDFVDKPGAVQSVIKVTHPVDLKPGSDDVIPARVTNTILGSGFAGRLFMNLREDKGYTYGAYSSLSSDELVGSFTASASVRNEVTDSAIAEFIYELERLRSEPVTDSELDLAKNYIAGAFARNLESPQTVANFALNTFRYDLPKDYYKDYLKNLEKVNVATVQETAEKYIRPDQARIVVVGNKEDVSEKLARFDEEDGEVTFYDIYANEKAAAEEAGDITGEEIVERYLEAIGGKERIKEVTSLKQDMTTAMMGQQVDVVVQQKAPNQFSMVMSMPGMVIMKQVFDGEKGYVEQMGQKMPLEGEMLDEMKEEARIISEMALLSDDYTLNVGGIEEVNGEKAYKVNATKSDGTNTVYYFGKETGYILKTIETQEANGQTATIVSEYMDYREVDGLTLPHKTKVTGMGPAPIEMNVQNIEVNGEIDPSVFQ